MSIPQRARKATTGMVGGGKSIELKDTENVSGMVARKKRREGN